VVPRLINARNCAMQLNEVQRQQLRTRHADTQIEAQQSGIEEMKKLLKKKKN
jgi:hypothetical protein